MFNVLFVSYTLKQQLKTMAGSVHVAYELVNKHKLRLRSSCLFVAPTATDNPGVSHDVMKEKNATWLQLL